MKLLFSKLNSLVAKYPSILTIGILAGITVVVGATVGILDQQQALASRIIRPI